MTNKQEMFEWAEAHSAEQLALLKKLAAIPAPSHHEEKRVEFIRNWLNEQGACEVSVDEALNVILRFQHECDGPYTVFSAHTDVVFPDTTALPVREENRTLYAPGVGDDTANLVALMMIAKYLLEKDFRPRQYSFPRNFHSFLFFQTFASAFLSLRSSSDRKNRPRSLPGISKESHCL